MSVPEPARPTAELDEEGRARLKAFLVDHRRRYITSGGVDGHVEDQTRLGGHAYSTNLLLRYKGRKSGKTFITPLNYGAIGGEVVIVGSKGGSDHHPQWYLNLRENPEVHFQVATQAFRGAWREPGGEEAGRIWDFMIRSYPFYAAYRRATTRAIPLVMMRPVERIPVFRMEEATGERESF